VSDTKTCECCSDPLTREMDVSDLNWARRRFCSEKCRKKSERKQMMDGNRGRMTTRYHNAPLTEVEVRQYADLVKSGVPTREAAKQVGRSNREALAARAVAFGFLERRVPVAKPAEDTPKITRIDPLPPGAPETWGAMMPDLKWVDAQRQIAQMGGR